MQYYKLSDSATYSQINGVSNNIPSGFTAQWLEVASGVLDVFGTLNYSKIDANAAIDIKSGGNAAFGIVDAGARLDAQAAGNLEFWDVYGRATIGATASFITVEQGGTVEALSGAGYFNSNVYGSLTVDAGAILSNITVESGGVVTLNAGVTANTISFDSASRGGLVVVKSSTPSLSTVSGLDYGDAIDFAGIAYSSKGSVAFSSSGQTTYITVTEGGVVQNLTATDSIANPNFFVKSDGAGGTLLMVAQGYVAPTPTHANDLARSGDVTGPYNFIDALNLEASYGDLIHAFGNNAQNMQNWLTNNQAGEKRQDSFDGLDYVASYGDLIQAFKHAGSKAAILDAGASHFIQNGASEGRSTSFNSLDYIASYSDLIQALGANGDAGAYHYIENGVDEGRSVHFDGLAYIASYGDLMKAFGVNEQAGAAHFIQNGFAEGRAMSFDGLDYIAGYGDLMTALGANADAGASHYIQTGSGEKRSAHPFDVAAYESAHPDLIGKYASDDAFLTAYINYYAANKTLLT